MKKQRMMKVILSSMIVASMAGAPAYAEQANPAAAVKLKFPDVDKSHWAMKHISKLAIEGIIDGYEDGSYRSENSVTQQEVIVMAIRMMGLEEKVKSSNSSTVFPFQVDEYAKPYVMYAIENKLINLQEEIAATPAKADWGKRNAAREWVAKIVIRAIGQQAAADKLASDPTPFKDSQDISVSSIGYINAAAVLEIVNGFEDGTFQPKGTVTRAQVATFLSRSQKELTTLSKRVVKGYVTALSGSSISLEDRNGVSGTYKLSSDTVFYGNKNEEQIAPSTIQQTYEVTLVQVGGTAYYVEVTNDQLQLDIYEGTLLKVSLDKLEIDLYENGNFEKYVIAPDVTVTDENGRGLSLASLVANSVIELRKSKLSKSDKITQIIVKQVPVNKSSEGTIQSIQKDANKITVLETATGKPETLTLSSKVITAFADNSLADINALHAGDTIAYEVANSEVAKIVIKKQADIGITVEGKVTLLSTEQKIINISKSAGGKLGAYNLANQVQVEIDGLASAGIFDIEVGDTVKLEVLNDTVTKISVTSRTVKNVFLSTIVDYNPDTKFLLVKDLNGKPQAFLVTDATSLIYNGSSVGLNRFSSYFEEGDKVNLKVSNDKLIAVTFSTSVEGSISQITSSDITIQTESGQNLTFKLFSGQQVEVANRPNTTTAYLKIGDRVTASLDHDQTSIYKLVLNQTLLFKTLLTNAASKQITVADENNTNIVYSLDDVPLTKANQLAAVFSDILTDEYLKVYFKGTSIVKAEIVTPLRGKVTAVDAASSSLTVQDFSGSSHVIALGSNYAVKQNGGGMLIFESLKAGDRVMVMKDAADKLTVQVAYPAQREYLSYNNVLNQLTFKPGASEKQSYNIHPRAYYHKGNEQLTAASFAAGDTVKIYMLDDKIVEMEKQ